MVEVAFPLLGAVQHFGGRVVGRDGDAVSLSLGIKPGAGVLGEPFPQAAVEFGAVGGRVAEHFRVCPFGVAHKGQQGVKLAGFQGEQFHIAVGRRQDAADAEVAGETGFGDALSFAALDGHIAYGELGFLGGGVHEPAGGPGTGGAGGIGIVIIIIGIDIGIGIGVDIGAGAGVEGGNGAEGGGQSGLVVAHIGAGGDGGAVGEGVQRHAVGQQPALAAGVKDGQVSGAAVGVGAAAAEGGGGDDDGIGVGGEEGVGVQAGGAGGIGGVVVDYQVNTGGQAAEQGAAGGIAQVEGDGLLAGVEVEEQAAAFRVGVVVREGAAAAGRVAGAGGFRLDDAGAEGRQELAAVGAGD